MRVKQRLRLNTIVSLAGSLAIFLMLVLALFGVREALNRSDLAGRVVSGAFERVSFRNDYMRTGSERAKVQWMAKHEQVGRLIESAAGRFRDGEDPRTLKELLRNQASIGKIFGAIVDNREKKGSPERVALFLEVEDRLLGQLNMRVYEAVFLGGKLQESSKAALFAGLRLAGGGILFVLLAAGAATLVNSWLMGRAITDRVGRLRKGATVIGAGKLDQRIAVQGDDEFAELSDAFNAMSAKLQGSYRDLENEIAERKRAEEALRKAHSELAIQVEERTSQLQEKEVLLKEVHHRVKNNLQVISSLVSLQADGLDNARERRELRELTGRVRSMALVHEKLYQAADLACIDFAEYTRNLLDYLWRAHGAPSAAVRLTLALEPVDLPVDIAVPCGLILNELAGNALKHAFAGRTEGEVTVKLIGSDEGRVCLSVSDDGAGFPAEFDWREAHTLGLRLVKMLAGQLGASVRVSSGKGTRFEVDFSHKI